MRTLFHGITLCFFLACVLPLKAQDNPIILRMEAFKSAYNAQDAQAISGFYTSDGALLPPRGNVLVGKDAIAAHYAAAFAQGVSNLELKILEIEQLGSDSILEIGVTRVTLGDQRINGRYMHIWKNENGAWMLHRDMYHVLSLQ